METLCDSGQGAAGRGPHQAPEVVFAPFAEQHKAVVVDIYNGYVLAGTAAFASDPVAGDFFDFLLHMPAMYPAYVLIAPQDGRVVGFCFLSPYHPQPTFRKTALVDYFLLPESTGKGLGSRCLRRLEAEAARAGIAHLIADVSSENHRSIAFHEARGFRRCGFLQNIGNKLGRDFGVVQLQKDI